MTQNPQDPQNSGNQPAEPEGEVPTPNSPTTPEAQEPAPPSAPEEPSFGSVVPPAPEQPRAETPQAPSYGSASTPPQQPGYGAPQQPGYGAPQAPSYGSASTPPPPPQQPGYGAPQQPGYGAPQQPGYGAPQQSGGFPAAPPPPGSYGQYGAAGYGGPGGPGGQWGGPQPFSVGAAIGYGWNAFKANAGAWIGGFLIVVLLSALVNWLLNPAVEYTYDINSVSGSGSGGMGMVEYTFAGQLLAGLAAIITYMLGALLIQGAVHKVNGRFDGFGAFFRFDHAGPLFLSALLLGAASLVIGLLSLATPFLSGLLNLVWGILTPFVLYIAADRGTQPIAAIQESFKLVTSNFGSVIVLWLATIGLVIAGIIVICFTGLIIVVPLLALAWAFAYKTLSGQQVAAP